MNSILLLSSTVPCHIVGVITLFSGDGEGGWVLGTNK